MNVVLPAPFGPISPTSWPSTTVRSTSSSASSPPNETEMPVADRTTAPGSRGFRGCPGAAATDGRAAFLSSASCSAASRFFFCCFFFQPVPAMPSGLTSSVTMSATPPMSNAQFPDRPNHSSNDVREEALRRADPGDDRTGDHRDPAEVRERDQREGGQRAEAAVAHRAEVVRVERAGHPGDERRDAEACELRVADVDARSRGRALVRAHGQHPLAQARAPHVGDEQGEEDRGGEDEEAEHRGSGSCRPAL